MRFTASLLCALLGSAAVSANRPVLEFRIDEGRNLNSFVRDGPVAAHLWLRAGIEPRLLVVFPAGNSGVGLWFEKTAVPVEWKLISPPVPVTTVDGKQRALHGIDVEVEANAAALRPLRAVLSSVRVLRDFELQRVAPDEVLVPPRIASARMTWIRDRLDGAAGYRLEIEAGAGTRVSTQGFDATPRQSLRLRIRALTGEAPLRPLDLPLNPGAGDDARARDVLGFLTYEEKYLAGSWRFNTYFGRDTLISATLLAPVLEPAAIESAINSVLDRLAPNGEVAHEEDIGEFAVLRNAREGRGRVATPIYDYGMVDDDFLLAPLAARYLLDDARGRARAEAFLASTGAGGVPRGKLLARNLAWLVERATPFAEHPRVENPVGIKAGRVTGNWRDSEQGLGRGRYPYDVNAALVPAALDAAARLSKGKLLERYLDAGQRKRLTSAWSASRVWSAHAPAFFKVGIPVARARADIAAYAREIGIDGARALGALEGNTFEFNALSLDEIGQPVPVLQSDEGFRLLFTALTAEEIETCLAIMRPFPAGLMTEIGLLVANPALARKDLRAEFGRTAYHGTVVWSWQQALLAAGLEHQLRRTDLPPTTRAHLRAARGELWSAIKRSNVLRTSELWTWTYSGGHFRAEPFGAGNHADESNAAQLWSTVFLGIKNDTAPEN